MKKLLVIGLLAMVAIAGVSAQDAVFGAWMVLEFDGSMMDDPYLAVVQMGESGGAVGAFPEISGDGTFRYRWKLVFPDFLGSENQKHDQAVIYVTDKSASVSTIPANTTVRGENKAVWLTIEQSRAFTPDDGSRRLQVRTWTYSDNQTDIMIDDWQPDNLTRALAYAEAWYRE